MDPTGQSLLRLLFDPGEEICLSNSQFAYHSHPLENAFKEQIELISPNENVSPIICNTSELLLCSVNPIQGFRLDKNVSSFRSFLIEIDVGSIKEQLGYLDCLKVPVSAQVFSGSKSVHSCIILDESFPDEKTYRIIGNWIFNIVSMADKNCLNPSRSVRIPGAYREPGKKQRLIKLDKRISHKELFDWLNQYQHLRPKIKEKKIVPQGHIDLSRLSIWAKIQLTKGIDFKNRGRNQTWYGLAYDLALAGFTEDKAIEMLGKHFQEEHDFKEKEWLITIGSAYKHVQNRA